MTKKTAWCNSTDHYIEIFKSSLSETNNTSETIYLKWGMMHASEANNLKVLVA